MIAQNVGCKPVGNLVKLASTTGLPTMLISKCNKNFLTNVSKYTMVLSDSSMTKTKTRKFRTKQLCKPTDDANVTMVGPVGFFFFLGPNGLCEIDFK